MNEINSISLQVRKDYSYLLEERGRHEKYLNLISEVLDVVCLRKLRESVHVPLIDLKTCNISTTTD
jgi:hypothetical protein